MKVMAQLNCSWDLQVTLSYASAKTPWHFVQSYNFRFTFWTWQFQKLNDFFVLNVFNCWNLMNLSTQKFIFFLFVDDSLKIKKLNKICKFMNNLKFFLSYQFKMEATGVWFFEEKNFLLLRKSFNLLLFSRRKNLIKKFCRQKSRLHLCWKVHFFYWF